MSKTKDAKPARKPSGKKQAVEAKRGTTFYVDPDQLVIVDDPSHVLYDERIHEPLEEETVQNIMLHGVLEDVMCRKDGPDLQVVFGRRRVLHAREAKKRLAAAGSKIEITVPVKVRRFASDAELCAVKVSENAHRKNLDPIHEAREIQRCLNFGMSKDSIRNAFGFKTVQTIEERLSLLDADKTVQKALTEKKVTGTEARKLAKLPRAQQKQALERKIEQKVQKKADKEAGILPKKAPSKERIRKLAESTGSLGDYGKFAKGLLLWTIGDLTDDQAESQIVGFRTLRVSAGEVEGAKAPVAATVS